MIGRSLFPLFLLWLSMNYSMINIIRRNKILNQLVMIPSLFWIVIYYPPLYRDLLKGHLALQQHLNTVVIIWIVAYISGAMFLFIHEYSKITINFLKKKFGYILLSQISITIFFVMFGIENPVYIFQPFGYEYLWGKYSYINPNISLDKWIIISVFLVFIVMFGGANLITTQFKYSEKREDASMQKKIRTAGQVVTIFVHGIKNQLIALKVLSNNISKEVGLDNPEEMDIERLREHVKKLSILTEQMTFRMDELYKSFRTKSIELHAIRIKDVIEKSCIKFNQKYPIGVVEITYEGEHTILADMDHLSEAIYNVLVNGYEALLKCQDKKNKWLRIRVYSERLYHVILIQDNGVGIDKKKQSKIFEPFFTDKNSNQNWGMGLYYVRRIVKYHLGFVRVESTENQGTSFYIMLPRYGR